MSTIARFADPHAPIHPTGMFSITTRDDLAGRVMVMGKPSRKQARAFLNIPLSQSTRRQLEEQLVGSLAMGTGALIEWALDELKRQGICLEARLRD